MSVVRVKELLDAAEALRVKHSEENKAMQAAYEAECQAAWKARFPRRKFSMRASADKAKGNQPEHGQIHEKWMAKYDAVYKAFKAALDANEKELVAEAAQTDIPVFDGLTLYHTTPSDNYRTQGFGMNKYAEADAQDYADKALAYGLQVHLRKVKTYEGKDCCGWSFTYYDYEVWVSTDEIGCEILSRKPETETMAEWVAKCDKRSVSARVFCPFMSYDLEEKLRRQAAVG
jgi:hypothetical protein